MFLWRVIPTLINRMGLIRYGQHGNPLLLTQHDGRTTIADPLRILQAAMQIDTDGRPVMPEMTPNQLQSVLNLNYWQTLIEQVRHAPGHTPQLPSETTPYLAGHR